MSVSNMWTVEEFYKAVKVGDAGYLLGLFHDNGLGVDVFDKYPSFFKDPASAKYHGSYEGGLARHSLLVYWYGLRFLEGFDLLFEGVNVSQSQILVSCLLHDLCKAGNYVWDGGKFKVKSGLMLMGHGSESIIRIKEYFNLGEDFMHAVRWHMGVWDISSQDKIYCREAIRKFPHVLWLQAADQMAGRLV